jgi:hypothetical protein
MIIHPGTGMSDLVTDRDSLRAQPCPPVCGRQNHVTCTRAPNIILKSDKPSRPPLACLYRYLYCTVPAGRFRKRKTNEHTHGTVPTIRKRREYWTRFWTMTSRIVAPVATVEDDSGEDYRDEICNMSTMSRSTSPPVENVITSFNEELDNFTKSFDEMASSIKKSAATPSYSRTPIYHFSTAKKTTPSRLRDPPPSADRHTPLRNYANSTPSRQRVSSSPSYTPAEPAPVNTPPFIQSPMPTPNPRRQDQSTRRQAQPPPVELDLNVAPNDWEEALNKMRQTLQDQEKRIQELEQENQVLRAQLQDDSNYYHEQPQPERLYREDAIPERSPWREHQGHREDPDGGTSRYSVAESRGREEPNGRRPASTASSYHTTPICTSMRSIRSPPSRIRTTNSQMIHEHEHEGFTPGTRFVAELSKLMSMGKGHHVPLSFILDKHWDQLKAHFGDLDL